MKITKIASTESERGFTYAEAFCLGGWIYHWNLGFGGSGWTISRIKAVGKVFEHGKLMRRLDA